MTWARNRALDSMGRLDMATSELLVCFRQLTATHLKYVQKKRKHLKVSDV